MDTLSNFSFGLDLSLVVEIVAGLLGLGFSGIDWVDFLAEQCGFFSVGKCSCIVAFPLSCLVFCLPPWVLLRFVFGVMVNLIFVFVSLSVFIFSLFAELVNPIAKW